jgi:hypothetical protein
MRGLDLCRLFAPLALAMAAFCHAQAVQPALTFEVASIKPSPPLDMAKAGGAELSVSRRITPRLLM